tara:strand:- start:510 stop:983 length:474 start_codon:yes stop_codon:yes gene_type:complete
MLSLLGLISLVLSACSHSIARQSDFLGEVGAEQLLAQYPTFQDEYESYQPSEKELAAVASLQDDSLVVLFGTWCHDSQREVPRLLKTFDLSGLDVPKLTLVAVDTKKNDPQGLAKKYALKYTPTFVLLKGDKELGRVIERPKMSLTEDLQLLSSMTK